MADRVRKAGAALALLLSASPVMAATAEDEALARELLVCGAKFGGLEVMTGAHVEAEIHAFFFEATKLAGPDFVERETPDTASEAGDWLLSKEAPQPTLDAARRACLPPLKQADALITSRHDDGPR